MKYFLNTDTDEFSDIPASNLASHQVVLGVYAPNIFTPTRYKCWGVGSAAIDRLKLRDALEAYFDEVGVFLD